MSIIEDDLDAILGELFDLQAQLNSEEGSNNLLLGLPSLPNSNRNQLNITQKYKAESINSLQRISPDEHLPQRINTDFCTSPDVDSAFGDSSSTEYSTDANRYRHSEISCSDSYQVSYLFSLKVFFTHCVDSK